MGTLELASNEYLRHEKECSEIPGADVVLVAAGPIELLKSAYPNYFADTREFLDQMLKIVGGEQNVSG